MLPRSDSPSHTLSATTRVRSLCQPLAHTHGLALRATNLIFSGSFLLCNNLHPSLLPASSSGLVCHSLPALSTPFTDALCPANKHTTQSTHIPNHVSSTEFSCLHAVLHLSHSECECCPAATPQVIVTHSLSETTPAHSFASLWLTLMALHSLQLIFSGSCLLCNNLHPRLSAQCTAVTHHALYAPFTGTHCPTSKNNAIQGMDSFFFFFFFFFFSRFL